MLSGKLLLNNFFADEKARQRYARHRWSTPGWQWVDPVKEAQAVELQLSLGIATLREVCGEQGKDWYEVVRERQQEIETCREMGIELPWFTPDKSQMEVKDEENEQKQGENGQE